jgi:hypothetical protein
MSTLALVKLHTDVSEWFATNRPTIPVDFGWREPTKHLGGDASSRVVFTPGDPAGSMGGTAPRVGPGGHPGRSQRSQSSA